MTLRSKSIQALFALVIFGFMAHSVWAEGAYKVEMNKGEARKAETRVTPLGSQANDSSFTQAVSNSSTASGQILHTHPAPHTYSPTGTYYSSQGGYYQDSETGFLMAMIEVLSMVGDLGLYGGYGYWQAPLSTHFNFRGADLWNDRPGLRVTQLGVSINVPILENIELEPYLGMMFGDESREQTLQSGYAKEHITLSEAHYGLSLLFPIQPIFFELGIGGSSLTTTCDIETTLPAFNYEGFLLDHASATQLTYGFGWCSPMDWNIRLRSGVQSYHQFADFGTSWGLRAYFTFMFSNKRIQYGLFE